MAAVIIDIEASGLHPDSYPIQIAWVTLDGSAQDCFYILPADHWTYWDELAEEVHGITRERLLDEGVTVTSACRRLSGALAGHKLYSDASAFDQFWIHSVFQSTGMLPPLDPVNDVTELVQPGDRADLVERLLNQSHEHHALADAEAVADAIRELWR